MARAAKDEELARRIESWAASELRLEALPPLEVLVALVSGAPRATDIWTHLVDRVRAPDHARLVRDACKLQARVTPPAPEPSVDVATARAELEKLEEQAELLEAEIAELQNSVLLRDDHAQENSLPYHTTRALQQAHGYTVHEACERIRELEHSAELASLSPVEDDERDPRYRKTAEEDISEALRVVRRALEMDTHAQETAQEVAHQYVERLARNQSVLDIVRCMTDIAAEGSQEASLPVSIASKAGTENEAPDDFISQLRAHHMDLFLQTEEVLCELRKANALLEQELTEFDKNNQAGTNQFREEALLVAQLQGERSAAAAVERELKSLNARASESKENQEHGVGHERALELELSKNEHGIACHRDLNERLQIENRQLVSNLANAFKELWDLLMNIVPAACRDAIVNLETEWTQFKDRSGCLAAMNLSRCLKIRVPGGWQPRSDFSVLASDDRSHSGKSNARIFENTEIAQISLIEQLLNDVLSRDIKSDADTAGVLESRALHVAGLYEQDNFALDAEYGPQFADGLNFVQDCIDRIVPSARSDIRVMLEQPVRYAAPWHRVSGKSLDEWESECRTRIESKKMTNRSFP